MFSTVTSNPASSFEGPCGFRTIDGEFVSGEVGQRALRDGTAVLVDGLLVGDFSFGLPALPSFLPAA